jgi:uncharacterized damage-inducible protein DinB
MKQDMETRRRPGPDEYNEFYDTYIRRVPPGSLVDHMIAQRSRTLEILNGIPPEMESYSYEPGKWTVRQLIGHVVDTERVMTGRALWIARGQTVALPGMDQDAFVRNANFQTRPFKNLIDEYSALRLASIALLNGFDSEVLSRRGTASGFSFTVRALMYIVAGHEVHHLRILDERYHLVVS